MNNYKTCTRPRHAILIQLTLLLQAVEVHAAVHSHHQSIPNPNLHPNECHNNNDKHITTHNNIINKSINGNDRNDNETTSLRMICDPDMLLKNISAVEEYILSTTTTTLCRTCISSDDKSESFEFGAALVRDLDDIRYMNDDDDTDDGSEIEFVVEKYARETHDAWGIGDALHDNGVFLLLVVDHRAMYISTGDGIKNYLTWWRLDDIMSGMKSLFLREGDYDGAIEYAFGRIQYYVEVLGVPDIYERRNAYLQYYGPIVVFVSFFVISILMSNHRERHLQREYAIVQSRLTRIEQDRAAALQGQYQCSSCPICLEDFQCQNELGIWTNGCDGKGVKLLRCGHAFCETCWLEWVHSSTSIGNYNSGDPTKCPVCREDVSSSDTSSNTNSSFDTASLLNSQLYQGRSNGIVNVRGTMNTTNRNNLNINHERYSRELIFRLARLRQRHPRFIHEEQIQRWSQPNYNGSIIQDKTFQSSNPKQSVQRGMHSSWNNNSNSSTGFSGGKSSGGRGGRW